MNLQVFAKVQMNFYRFKKDVTIRFLNMYVKSVIHPV